MPRKLDQTTLDEIEFLKHIGSYSSSQSSKKQLLEGCLEGYKLRDDWKGLDKKEIINFAKNMMDVI